jgi:hypothetical protein
MTVQVASGFPQILQEHIRSVIHQFIRLKFFERADAQ